MRVLAPACSLPGQRRRDLRGRQHLASGTPDVSGSHQGSRQTGARQIPRDAAPEVSRSHHPRRGVAQALDPPRHRMGQRRTGGARLPRSLCLSRRLSPMPGSSVSMMTPLRSNTSNARPGAHGACRLSGHEFMRRFLQRVLPRGFHKVRSSAVASWGTPQHRPGEANVATPVNTEVRSATGLVVPFVPPGAEPAPSIDPQICRTVGAGVVFIRTLSPRQAMAP